MAKRPNIVFRKKAEGNGILSSLTINLNDSAFIDVRNLYRLKEFDFDLKTELTFTKVSDYIYKVNGSKKGFYSVHLEVDSKKGRGLPPEKEISLRSNTLIIIVSEYFTRSSSTILSSSNLKSSK